ncbi:MAG: YSC84-related protein [Paracoccaceae bacterium]
MLEKFLRGLGRGLCAAAVAMALASAAASPAAAGEADAAELREDSIKALHKLYANDSGAAALGDKAVAVLVFPRILKAGFIVGGAGGTGTMLRGEEAVGYYSSLAASYGLQAGAQTFGYALFFMNEAATDYLARSDGWEVGVGPSVVVLEKGVGKKITSSTVTEDIYAVIFDQSGLMAGLGIEGSKISPYNP